MKRLVVIGDVLLDRDVEGTVERLCPDAPVPVVDQQHVTERPGGAGLAATLAALDSDVEVTLVAPVADDTGGRTLRRLLENARVTVCDWHDPGLTAEKERVHVSGRPIVRIDRGGHRRVLPAPPPTVSECVERADAVLVSDYGRGVTDDRSVRAALAKAIVEGVPVIWDPHPRGAAPVPGVAVATPNLAELALADADHHSDHDIAGPAGGDLERLVARARRVRTRWSTGAVCVTRGAAGAVLVMGDGAPLVVPVDEPVTELADACGAGDAFASACAAAFAGGAVGSEAIQRGVARAAAFVRAGGALAASADARVRSAPSSVAATDGTTVATGGCFDLLHAGHVATLQRARLLGDRLVVLLNGDRSVHRLKGPGRPIQSAEDRAAVLRSLSCVDDVVVFDEDTPVAALRALRPAVFVKGGDYSSTEIPEAPVLAEWGGVVVTVPYLAGRSTTGLVHQMGAAGVV
jgi:D-beta-D-heptose 7-phosphate kinase / D-beta-D-heptose 1-phosphate adenosyltransferase